MAKQPEQRVEFQEICFVRWVDETGEHRGFVDIYSRRTMDAFDKGKLIVIDAILPVEYVVEADDVDHVDFDEHDAYVKAEFRKAVVYSDSLQEFGPGKLFSVQTENGEAWYAVTNTTDDTATVEWRRFDRSLVPPFHKLLGAGTELPRNQVAEPVRQFEEAHRLSSPRSRRRSLRRL